MKTTNQNIINEVKQIIYQFDKNAQLTLFGSRARGDYEEYSDWDFLILTDLNESESIKDDCRTQILHKIELPYNESIQIIWHNKNVWNTKYKITGLYKNIEKEGKLV